MEDLGLSIWISAVFLGGCWALLSSNKDDQEDKKK